MNMIGYEIKKLTGIKSLWVFVLLFFVLNVVVAFVQTPAPAVDGDVAASFFDLYKADPQRVEADYREFKEFTASQDPASPQAGPGWTDRYFPGRASDEALFDLLFSQKEYLDKWPDTMERVVYAAGENLQDYSQRMRAGFQLGYQQQVINVYSPFTQRTLELAYVHGYDEYLTYDVQNILVAMLCILMAAHLFLCETETGTLSIVRTAKRGRAATGLSKVAVLFASSALLTLLFCAGSFIAIGCKGGYSGIDQCLPAFSTFQLCPFSITVWQALLLQLGIRLAGVFVWSLVAAGISLLVRDYAVSLLSSGALYGISVLLAWTDFSDANHILRLGSLHTLIGGSAVFTRYHAVNVFSCAVPYVAFIPAFLLILAVALVLFCVAFYSRAGGRTSSPGRGWMKRLGAKTAEKWYGLLHHLHRNKSRRGLVAYEFKKNLLTAKALLIVAVILAAKAAVTAMPAQDGESLFYEIYMNTLQGPMTDEKHDYIAAERQRIDHTIVQYEAMREAYQNDDISYTELVDYMSEYWNALAQNEAFARIEGHAAYIDARAQAGVSAWFVYDSGWDALFHKPFDVCLSALLLLLTAELFSREYTSGFAGIMRSTRRGRGKTFCAKMLVAVTVSLVFTAVFTGVDLWQVSARYALPLSEAPLASLESFGTITGSMTIAQYLCLYVAVKLTAFLMLVLFSLFLSAICKRAVLVLSVVVSAAFLPHVLRVMALENLRAVDMTALLAVSDYVGFSAGNGLFGDFGLLGIALAATVLLAAFLGRWAYVDFCRA